MANDWTSTPLAELSSDVSYGYTESACSEKVGPHFLRITDIQNGTVNWGEVPYCPITREHHEKYKLSDGDIVIARTGNSTGENYLYQGHEDAVFASYLIRFRIDQQKADPKFVWYNLRTRDWWDFINNSKTGSAQVGANAKVLGRFLINCPSISEQRAIANILGTLDDKIELNRYSNETLEAMVRALFKAWFVDFEPVRAKIEGRWQRGQSLPGLPAHLYDLFPTRLVESELGEIPEGWQTLPVYDIATYVNGAAFKAFQPNDERRGLPIIKIAELKSGVTVQTKFSDVAMPEKFRLRTGDILFSWSGNPDTSIDTFIWTHGDAWLNQHIFRVDIHSPNERAFIIATLKWLRPVFAEIARNKQTTGLGHVTVGDMQRLLVVKPDEHAMAAWDRMAAPIFAAAFRNESDSISLARLRDTLLPKLISGDLRVPDVETFMTRIEHGAITKNTRSPS